MHLYWWKKIIIVDGHKIEYHQSFKLPHDVYQQTIQEDLDNLNREFAEYECQKGDMSEV